MVKFTSSDTLAAVGKRPVRRQLPGLDELDWVVELESHGQIWPLILSGHHNIWLV